MENLLKFVYTYSEDDRDLDIAVIIEGVQEGMINKIQIRPITIFDDIRTIEPQFVEIDNNED